MPLESKPIARKENLLVQEANDEVLIYDLKAGKALCLNETSAMAFQLCDGTRSITEISGLMSKRLKTLVSEDFIRLAVNELRKANLLENEGEIGFDFGGLSRREIVKKVGIGSMIALPLISSVIAPSAVMAQSACIMAGFAPGTISNTFCSSSSPDCNLNFGPSCCSGMAANIAQPCPLVGSIPACACV